MKMTPQLVRVLRAFLADPAQKRYGYDLMKAAELPSGTLYPMLARMEEQGMVESNWEDTPQREGQPLRKYYQLTGEGARVARIDVAAAPLTARPPALGPMRPAPERAP